MEKEYTIENNKLVEATTIIRKIVHDPLDLMKRRAVLVKQIEDIDALVNKERELKAQLSPYTISK